MSDPFWRRAARRAWRTIRPQRKGRPFPASADFALAVPFAPAARSASEFRIAVVLHLYHTELAVEFRDLVNSIRAPCDILLTTDTHAKCRRSERAFAGWSKGEVFTKIVENRGRDIAPKLTAFSGIYADYDLILFLHSKKSNTVDWGDAWRRQITSSLAGSAAIVDSILTLFDHYPTLGMVAPKTFERLQTEIDWGDPGEAQKLADRLGVEIDPEGSVDFPAGSMFWVRPAALKPLLTLGLSVNDFPAENGQTDATLAHAVERMFYVVCELAGFDWLKVADPAAFDDHSVLRKIESPDDIEPVVKTSTRCVSSTMLRP